MATFVRPADAYRARHRSPADAYRAKYRDAGSICALADLRVEDDGVARASLSGLPGGRRARGRRARVCQFQASDVYGPVAHSPDFVEALAS